MHFKPIAASVAALALIAPNAAATATLAATPAVAAPALTPAAAQRQALIAAVRNNVKYVFVLYQENRSFDSYFGTFPKADGIYSRPANQTLGYTQQIENTDGTFSPISPFRIGPEQYAADTDDVDHSHPRLISKIDVTMNGPQMDKFALVEEAKPHGPASTTGFPTLEQKQYGELTMAYEDCDTIPLLWNYANRFVLFDHIFQSYLGPSTPGNIAIVAAQAGETQDALHPSEGYPDNGGSAAGVPVLNDRNPAWGPYNPGDNTSPAALQLNLTFASLPLSLAGSAAPSILQTDSNPGRDFADTMEDIAAIGRERNSATWGWFEEGYAPEAGETALASASSYITHHNGPQYFGYVANTVERNNLHNLTSLGTALKKGQLAPGVFYVKGGYTNLMGLKPADPDPAVQQNFVGDDDHPGYSDAQISEALVAKNINAIVQSKYWSQSAIIVTYDDSEGDYDHVAPPIRAIGPGVGNVPADYLGNGPRVPTIVISPFAKDHVVEHAYGDTGSVVKFVDTVFNVTPLANLPDEIKGSGAAAFAGKINYGPDDGETSGSTNLLDAFDPARLAGRKAPLPAAYAYVPTQYINRLPQQTGLGCAAIGVIPVDRLRGMRSQIPADFNPRPGTDPTPTSANAVVKPVNTRAEVQRAHDLDD